MKKSLYSKYFKRFIDFNLALLALIILSPLFLIIIILQILFNGFPIFFTQLRVGKNEKIFKLIKFRTMTNIKDKEGKLLADKFRITLFGSFLRTTSIDELPSLLNILKGDMAIIGPRPLLIEYLPLYNQEQRKRHLIRPGLSGLAQINGRNKISWKKKFEYDVKYVNNISFLLDFKIIILTIFKVFYFEGVNKNNEITMDKFNGNN